MNYLLFFALGAIAGGAAMNIVKCLTSIKETKQHVKDVEELHAMWKNDYKRTVEKWQRAYAEQAMRTKKVLIQKEERIEELERLLNAQKDFFEVDVKKTKEAKTMFGGF